ncbi:MAG: ExbD/TolR family protein [Verrucomicrobiaceae bacterium]|jgi:biopolymer transport protein ExbD
MGGGGGGGENGEPEFQIAPMIDVLLTLLIFFMSITTAEVIKVDKGIELPIAESAKKKDENNSMNEVLLNIRWEVAEQKGLVTYNERKFPNLEELVPILEQKYATNNKARVIIRGDKRLPAVEVQKVMTVIGQSGISDISFSALSK